MGIKDKLAEKMAKKIINAEASEEETNEAITNEAISQAKELGRMIMADELAELNQKIAEQEQEIDTFNVIAENAYANENCFRLHLERNQKGTPFFEECVCSNCSHALGCYLGEEDEWQTDKERCTLTPKE